MGTFTLDVSKGGGACDLSHRVCQRGGAWDLSHRVCQKGGGAWDLSHSLGVSEGPGVPLPPFTPNASQVGGAVGPFYTGYVWNERGVPGSVLHRVCIMRGVRETIYTGWVTCLRCLGSLSHRVRSEGSSDTSHTGCVMRGLGNHVHRVRHVLVVLRRLSHRVRHGWGYWGPFYTGMRGAGGLSVSARLHRVWCRRSLLHRVRYEWRCWGCGVQEVCFTGCVMRGVSRPSTPDVL